VNGGTAITFTGAGIPAGLTTSGIFIAGHEPSELSPGLFLF
jgi:hypothetical protein